MKKIILTILTLLYFGISIGQNISNKITNITSQNPGPSGFVRCSTPENEAALRELYPERETEAQTERWIVAKIAQIKADRAAGRNIQTIYNIPVVVHVIHNGDAVGVGENITDAQVLSQITVLNQDFRRMISTPGGANSTGLAVDCEINFCMAQTSPTGTLTNGIDRLNITPTTNSVANTGSFGGGADWETRAAVETMKTTTQWDPTNYFNFWVIRVGGNNLPSGINDLLGYAQFPTFTGIPGLTGGAANTDGVVCRFDAFGTSVLNDGSFKLSAPYDKGRTMTHEVGHFLGLRHIWGDSSTCPATNNSADKDYCADTPAANAPNYTCAVVNSCSSTPGNDMVQNYMDYTDDTCMDTFTQNQKDRVQAVMAGAIRRSSLNASTACQTPTPIIRYQDQTGSINEGTNCSYTDYTYAVTLGKSATAAATITFNITSGTAIQNVDYVILNPTVTFAVGTTTTQYLTIRVNNDGLVEGNETINIGLTLNANGGDATLNPGASSIALTIVDNDFIPLSTQQNPIFTRTFDPFVASEIITTDLDGDTYNWGVGASAAGSTAATIGFTSNFAFSRSWDSTASPTALTPDNIMTFTTPITIPSGTNTLTYGIGTTQGGTLYYFEHYAVYLTPTNNAISISGATPVIEETLSVGAARTNKSVNISAYAGQTVYLSFRHFNTVDKNLIMLDDVSISNTISASIQTVVDSSTSYQALTPGTGITYAKDATTAKIILSLTNNNNMDYGCANMFVSRDETTAGAAAVNYGSNTLNGAKVMAKTFTVSTANNQPTGNATFTFYFTEAEIAAWETATGNSRNSLKVIKAGFSTAATTTLGAFGTAGPTLTATFTDGANGVYYFGTDASLANTSFESASDIFVYPNPTNETLNISIPTHFGLPNNIIVTNYLGQTIDSKSVNSDSDLKLNTAALSNGVYFITVVKGTEKKTMRFIKK
jgi:hypothetical protein